MPKKRGQVSIFLVLAIILLIAGAFYFYYQKAIKEEIVIITPEIAPAKTFIDECIKGIAQDAITILGQNGGYITFPESIEINPRSYLSLGPAANIKNPYWWYDGISNIPSEAFIARQIEDYIEANLESCIDAFNSQYDVQEKGDVEAGVSLNENDVTVKVKYPLELSTDKTTLKLENFRQTIPIRLKKVYQTARDIMEAENRDLFFEFKTIDLITLDEDIPTTDLEATCEEKVWVMEDVKNKLKRLLAVNFPYVVVQTSDFNEDAFVPNPFGEDSYKDTYFNTHYKWLVSDKNYEGLKVSFNYDERWPFLFYARPSSNGLMKSNAEQSQDLLDFFCFHIWHFTYDVNYPVLASIIDDEYQFNFAFKVNVDHNQPRREYVATTLLERPDLADKEEFCSDEANEITIYTISNSTALEDIVDVNLTFTCGVFTCGIGQSEWLSFGAAAGLTTYFPYCVNGILRGEKEGFEDSQMFISTESPAAYDFYMKPIKEFSEYDVVKHDLDNPELEKPLTADEKASITLESASSSFRTFGTVPFEENFPLKLINDEHEYEVSIYLTDGNEIIGGYQGTWTVNPSDANRIKFHVLEKKGSTDEKALFVSALETYSEKVPKPELT